MNTDPAAPRWVILVKPGVYHERIYVQRERGQIRVVGEDVATTVITFDLNANLPGPDGKPISTFRTPTVQIDGDGMIWENITLANGAGPVGQALALRADGDRLVFRNCRFLGWQDTLLLNRGRQYFENCYIEGHVDFIFGGATAYFKNCRIHCLRDGYITAASTPKGESSGFVFADCKITGETGVKTYLGRPWRDFARTVFLRTEMSEVVRPAGWDNWKKPQAERSSFYAEFGSTGPGANDAARVKWARTLTAEDVAMLTAERVLAGDDGWNPLTPEPPSGAGAGRASAKGTNAAAKSGASNVAPAVALASAVALTATPAQPRDPADRRVRIVLVGDSTVTDHSGWGTGFKRFLTADAECINTSLGGRSSKSFRDEGHWEPALALHGDYYLIQFGHNDQPGKGPDRETDPQTTFAENMARYVTEVRAIGAQPILVTSLTRRDFDRSGSGKLADTLEPYAEATRRVAARMKVPLIDLHARSLAFCEQLGPEKCEVFNLQKETGVDHTHLDAGGSVVFARFVVEDLRRAVPALAPVLRQEPGPALPAASPKP
jgi:pectinesterase